MPLSSRKLVIFGAGKIGRSFIAQLFSAGGYQTVFIDIDHSLVDAINRLGTYDVIIKDLKEDILPVNNIRAVHFDDTDRIIDEIVTSRIMAVSVGIKGLDAAIPLIARGLIARQTLFPHSPIDIIIAENMRDGAEWMEEKLREVMPDDFPLNTYTGLVETSIGKMVPLMKATDSRKNPLDIFAEAYNTLILDKNAFVNPIPDIPGLAPKENMKAWVDRKLFIHNLGHAALAYFSFIEDPSVIYTWEALENSEVRQKVLAAMGESALVLQHLFPGEFTVKDLEEHINDLLKRFANRSLGDTIFRVGCDLERKLGPDDRLVPVIRQAFNAGLSFGSVLETLVAGIYFDARDESGKRLPSDDVFLHKFNRNLTEIMQFHCNFDPSEFPGIFSMASRIESEIKANLK